MSKKLEQVLEYLIANDEAKAKELLHQVFIEKARKIHEEMVSQDEMDEMIHMGGDEGEELEDAVTHGSEDLEELSDEIDAEETMAEDADEVTVDVADDMDASDDLGAGDDMGGMDMGGEEAGSEAAMDEIEDTIGDLEDALAELKAEFEKLESGSEEAEGEEEEVAGEEEEAEGEEEEAEGEEEEEDEEEMDEGFLEEDFDDLAEGVELDKVSVPASGEVGAGKFSSDTGEKAKSPTATSQTSRMGAKPVAVDSKHHSGYNRETAPSSKDMGLSSKRKSADAGTSKVSKEGDKAAAINKTASEFGADTVGKNSPLSKTPRK